MYAILARLMTIAVVVLCCLGSAGVLRAQPSCPPPPEEFLYGDLVVLEGLVVAPGAGPANRGL